MNTKTEDRLSSTNVEKETASAISEPSITESVPSVTESEPSSAENAPYEQRREAPVERRVHGTVTRRTVGRTGNAARGETAEKRDAGERGENAENRTPVQQGDPSDSGIVRRGIFEICSDNYGFLRNDNYLPSEHDVYINPSMIRRYNLTTGDVVEGTLKRVTPGSGEKFVPLHHITKINDKAPELAMHRRRFDRLTPVFPHERLRMEYPGCNVATRAVDLFSPIGKGQRGMIVSQPKAGKTTLLKQIARSILMNHKNVHLIILLIDER
ncbi:MAG: transcription termination factor Rho, partial [Lachnospiraceae bacterium]|nr:transcription termination factor Rho [Lachnospiraceae bacterium]